MALKTIGLTLLEAASTDWLVPAACILARRDGAHLVGVYAAEPLMAYGGGTAFDPVIVPEFLDWQKDEAEAIRTAFETRLAEEGIAGEFRGLEAGRLDEDFLADGLRGCDLVISPRVDRASGSFRAARLQEQVIRTVGRPVLILPKARAELAPAQRIAIGISATREATRAAFDALLLAAPGAAIDLVAVGPDSQPGRIAFDLRQDLAAAFDRHGFATTLVDRHGALGQAGEMLLAAAAELGADVVATGAFGHSRTYDFVIGAATTHLLAHAELPVLLSK